MTIGLTGMVARADRIEEVQTLGHMCRNRNSNLFQLVLLVLEALCLTHLVCSWNQIGPS